MSERATTYLTGNGNNSGLVSRVSSLSPGLYHFSDDIRNEILKKNLGKYEMYKESISATGGEAIGEPYFVGDELHPIAIGENGLYGYTHDTELEDTDPLRRNENVLNTFYDYPESKDIEARLNDINHGLPWNGQLYGRSDVGTQENSTKFTDYREYMKSMFRFGLSFETSLNNRINSLMFNGYTPNKSLVNDITLFVDSHQGTILNPVPVDWSNGDTELGYIGKKMVENQRFLRSNSLGDPITEGINYESKVGTINQKGTSAIDLSSGWSNGGAPWQDVTQEQFSLTDGSNKLENTTAPDSPLLKNFRNNVNVAARRYNISRQLGRGFVPWDPYAKFIGGSFSNVGFLDNKKDFDTVSTSPVHGAISPDQNTIEHGKHGYSFYNEGDTTAYIEPVSMNNETVYGQYDRNSIQEGNSDPKKSLLQKTRQLFKEHKIKTLVSRFHTSDDAGNQEGIEETQTAVTNFGISHGRNLLKKLKTDDNGYENPYCRVWTYHHQYSRMNNLIRPFSGDDGESLGLEELQKSYPWRPILNPTRSGEWNAKSVLNRNGTVNISPMYDDDFSSSAVGIKQCMFSIENLAWKGVLGGTSSFPKSEVGPLGGRIMWFPPYDLSITENASVQWQGNDFIGRGEKIYTYANTERSGTLNFTIVADHPSIINYWLQKRTGGRTLDETEAESLQQDLLRFYAGCDNLDVEADITENQTNDKSQKSNKDNNKDGREGIQDGLDDSSEDNFYSFYLFFPNNLSGKDWMGDERDIKQMADYLMYGKHRLSNITITETGVTDENIAKTTSGSVSQGAVLGYEMTLNKTEGITEGELKEKILENNTKYNNAQGPEPKSLYVWGYGRNKNTAGQKLTGGSADQTVNPLNYVDSLSLGLNANRGGEIGDPDVNCSFADMYIALQMRNQESGGVKAYLLDCIKQSNKLNDGDAEKLSSEIYEKLFDKQKLNDSGATNNNRESRKIYFCISSSASSQGQNVNKNQTLSEERGAYLRKWIEAVGGPDWVYSGETVTKIEQTKSFDTSDKSAKLGRMAKVKIWWPSENISTASVSTDENKKVDEETEPAKPTQPQLLNIKWDTARYGEEYKFFKQLKSSDQILYKNIVNKIKFFDPAFHAITPEGFNGRLAFLHQCTRQGDTLHANSEKTNGYAGNLAFGRPPVCVLRLGDFYNTRIVINSMNIQFENNQWDLNPEGIGVQPMLAKISLNFVFQGGSSLGGPVTRLQNAISFNYYANQEVYDDRADVMKYTDKGDVSDESIFWVPGVGAVGENRANNTSATTETSESETEVGSTDKGVIESRVNEAESIIEENTGVSENAYDALKELAISIDGESSTVCLTPEMLPAGSTFSDLAEVYQDETVEGVSLVAQLIENCGGDGFDWLSAVNFDSQEDLGWIVQNKEAVEYIDLHLANYITNQTRLEKYVSAFCDKNRGVSYFSNVEFASLNNYLGMVSGDTNAITTLANLLYSLTFDYPTASKNDRWDKLEKLGLSVGSGSVLYFDPNKPVGMNKDSVFATIEKLFQTGEDIVYGKLSSYGF